MMKRSLTAALIVGATLTTAAQARHFYDAGQTLSHPSGCPWHAFCGCGVSLKVFGRSIRDLWLASNWLRFPRAAPGPGMVAVWPHHVAYIESMSGGKPLLYDPNSGGHLTRMHHAPLTGAVIVNPNGGNNVQVASAEKHHARHYRHYAHRHYRYRAYAYAYRYYY